MHHDIRSHREASLDVLKASAPHEWKSQFDAGMVSGRSDGRHRCAMSGRDNMWEPALHRGDYEAVCSVISKRNAAIRGVWRLRWLWQQLSWRCVNVGENGHLELGSGSWGPNLVSG